MEKVCVERTLWISKFSLKTGWGTNPFLNYHFDKKATVSTFFTREAILMYMKVNCFCPQNQNEIYLPVDICIT